MEKEELVNLTEALASVGYKITSFKWSRSSFENPHWEALELEIIKDFPREKKLNPET